MMVQKRKKQQMKFNLTQLDKITTVLLMGRHQLITRKFLNNIYELFCSFDENTYSEIEKSYRVNLIKKLSYKRLAENIHDKEALIALINTEGVHKEQMESLLSTLDNRMLSDDEIVVLDGLIADNRAYGFMDNTYNDIMGRLNDYKAENYEDFTEWIDSFNDIISDLSYNIRTRRSATLDSKNDVSLSGDSLVNSLTNIIAKKKKPGLKIRTGIKAMNNMLDGGWEPGRLYLAAGVAKGWKSGWLLNSALAAKKHNKNLQAKDPKKKPVILYVTQENTIDETMERVWASLFGNDSKMEDYAPEVAINMLQTNGIIPTPGSNEPELEFRYRSNKSISTMDLDAMIEELENEGKEVVFLVHDYIKRIRPASSNVKDLRLELGDVANEMKSIAVDRDIPVLTAHQLNREAFRAFDESTGVEQHFNVMKKLGAAQIGESIDIIQNVDYAFILSRTTKRTQLHPDQDPVIEHFLHVKEIASRFKDNGSDKMFMHPFPSGYTMALVEDCDSVESMSTFAMNDIIESQVNSNKGSRNINVNSTPPNSVNSDVYNLRPGKKR